jgi:hypothetical protein
MTHPQIPLVSALLEGAQRYLPKLLPKIGDEEVVVLLPEVPAEAHAPNARDDLAWLSEQTDKGGQRVCLVQHLALSELQLGAQIGHEEMATTFGGAGVRGGCSCWIL